MLLTYVKRIEWFIILVLLQVLVLNHVHFFGYATPYLYIYLILRFSTSASRNELMLWSFFLGLMVDVFSDTPGMNAAACVFLAFSRPTILRLFSPRDMSEDVEPSFKSLGINPFVKYMIAGVWLHTAALMLIESFSFFSLPMLLLKITASAVLTIVCLLAIEGIRK